MNIGYISYWSARDVKHWSGLVYYIAKALVNQGIELEYIDGLHSFQDSIFKIKSAYVQKILRKKYQRFREPLIIKKIGKIINERLKNSKADILFSSGSLEISQLETDKKIAFWSDALFAGLLDFYPEYTNLYAANIKNGHYLEQTALDKASLILLSSDWAAKTAIENYNVDSSKIKVVPFGANIDINFDYADIKTLIEKKKFDPLKILWIGVDWERKGGDILLDAVRILNNQNIKTELNIVGCSPEINTEGLENINIHGFISKATEQGKKLIEELFTESHIFIMPTKGEAYGLVYCEANAYGLPVIGPDLGGVPTIIKDGVNGYLVNNNDMSSQIAEKVLELYNDHEKYVEMSLAAFNEYQTRLNWDVAGKQVKKYLQEL